MAKGFELKVVDASGLTDADWTGINKVMSAVGVLIYIRMRRLLHTQKIQEAFGPQT